VIQKGVGRKAPHFHLHRNEREHSQGNSSDIHPIATTRAKSTIINLLRQVRAGVVICLNERRPRTENLLAAPVGRLWN
jgi:hypothetical protein